MSSEYTGLSLSIDNVDFKIYIGGSAKNGQGSIDNGAYEEIRHSHMYYEVFFTYEGTIDVKTADQDILVHKGNCLVIRPRTIHISSYSCCSLWACTVAFDFSKNKQKKQARYIRSWTSFLTIKITI